MIIISFDGMRHDYLEKTNTPNFDAFIKSGVKAKSLIPVFPSYTFPNHYSIATGTYPGYHMITENKFFDKKLKKKYSLYDKNSVEDSSFYKGEPIWVTAEKQGIKTASFFWVGSEAPIKGLHPSIFKKYDGTVPFTARVDSVISWLTLPNDKKPKLIMLYFHEPDKSGHIYGPNSVETINAIKESDQILGNLINKLKKHGINANIIVLSDHGMREIDPEKVIIINEFIENHDSLKFYGNGPLMQIDIEYKSKFNRKKLLSALNTMPNINVFLKHNFPKHYHFINRNSGDLIIVPEPGWLIFTKKQLNETNILNSDLNGMHGWIPEDKKMHGIFFANGPDIKQNSSLNSFENTAIYGIISELLDLEPYSNEKYLDGAIINQLINRNIIQKN